MYNNNNTINAYIAVTSCGHNNNNNNITYVCGGAVCVCVCGLCLLEVPAYVLQFKACDQRRRRLASVIYVRINAHSRYAVFFCPYFYLYLLYFFLYLFIFY